jgi:predicted enzyme related to lactoylglutathione lyase
MPERNGYIAGVPSWVDTTQPDPEAAASFYGGLFGWEVENQLPADAPGVYLMARLRGLDVAGIGSTAPGAPPMATWNTYIQVNSADETAVKVRQAGGRVITEPFDVTDAGRMAVFADTEGAPFCVWQPNRHPGAQIVNEHGAVNFNTLQTRDPEPAKTFYGAVFGWQTMDLGGGGAWTLPGYGDHLEANDPGLRARVVELGGPTGFEDVVASISVIGPEQANTPAHWSVTFGVDDADAIADRAIELGGKLLMGPSDAPWVRMAVIADPAGATFIASQFVPENRDLAAPTGAAAA